MSFRSVSQLFTLGAVLFVFAAGALSLYTSGYMEELYRGALAPDGSISVRSRLVQEAERSLGARGAAGAIREYVLTGEPNLRAAAGEHLAKAVQAADLYQERASSLAHQRGGEDFARVISQVRSLIETADGLEQGVAIGRIDAVLSQLASLRASLTDLETQARISGTVELAQNVQTVLIAIFGGMFLILSIAVLMIRGAVRQPLAALTQDLEDLATAREQGGVQDQGMGQDQRIDQEQGSAPATRFWGTNRQDEIGALARAVERLDKIRSAEQAHAASPPVPQERSGPLEISLTGPGGDVFDSVVSVLRDAANDLTERGERLETCGREGTSRAEEEIGRLSTAVTEIETIKERMESQFKAQRKDVLTLTGDLKTALAIIRDTDESLHAKIEKVLGTVAERTQELNSRVGGMEETVQTAASQFEAAGNAMTATQDAVSGLMTGAREAGEVMTTVTQTFQEQLTSMIVEIKGEFHAVQGAAGVLSDCVRDMGEAVSGFRGEMDSTFTEFSGRLGAAADVIQLTADRMDVVSTGPEAEGHRTREILKGFGENVVAGIAKIDQAMEQAAGRVDALALDMAQVRTAMAANPPAQPEPQSKSGLPIMSPEMVRELKELSTLQAEAIGEACEDIRTLATELGGIETRLSTVLADALKDPAALESLSETFDGIVGGLSDGLTDVVVQMGRVMDEQGVASAAASRQHTELRSALEAVTDRLTALAEEISRVAEGESRSDGPQETSESIQRDLDEALARFGDTVVDHLNRLEGQTGGLTQALGVTSAMTESLNEAVEKGFTSLEALTSDLSGRLEKVQGPAGNDQDEDLSVLLDDVVGRIETRLLALNNRVDDLVQGKDTGDATIPVNDLRTCVEEMLAPFAQGVDEAGDGLDAPAASALLKEVVEQVSALAETVESQKIGAIGSTDQDSRLVGIEAAIAGLRADLDMKLQTLVASSRDEGDQQAADLDDLRGLMARLEEQAHTVFQKVETQEPSDLILEAEPVVQSLSSLVDSLRASGHLVPEADSLGNAVSDIKVVAGIIETIERRASDLADQIKDGDASADLDDPAAALEQLEAMKVRLGNIAEALSGIGEQEPDDGEIRQTAS